MKTSTVALAALATLFSSVSADACTSGLMYCGYNLLRVGNYRGEINQELYNKHIDMDEDHVNNSLFECGAGGKGWIGWKDYCSTGCRDGGRGRSDSC